MTSKDLEAGFEKEPRPDLPLPIRVLISEPVVLAVIALNALIFAAVEIDPSIRDVTGPWIDRVDYVCILFFVLEACAKIVGLGPAIYWRDNWNKYDLTIVVFSLPALAAPFVEVPVEALSYVTLFRTARLLRIGRLLYYASTQPLVRRTRWPIYAILLIAALGIAVESVELSPEVAEVVGPLRAFLLAMSLTWLASGVVKLFFEAYLMPRAAGEDAVVDQTLLTFLGIVADICIWVGGFGVALEAAGQNAMAVFAGLGIGGVALAFAAQEAVANVIGGVMIFFQRPFRVGDLVRVQGVEGWINSIGLRSFTIQEYGGEIVHIPNKVYVGEQVTNIEVRESYMQIVPLTLHHTTTGAQLEQAVRLIIEAIDGSGVTDPELRWVNIIAFGETGCRVEIQFYVNLWGSDDAEVYPTMWNKLFGERARVMVAVVKALEGAGIRLAEPVRFALPGADVSDARTPG